LAVFFSFLLSLDDGLHRRALYPSNPKVELNVDLLFPSLLSPLLRMTSQPPHLAAIEAAASTRAAITQLHAYETESLENAIKHQARLHQNQLIENALLRERVELLEARLEQRDSDIEVLWEEIGSLSQKLHPQGHWEFEPGRDEVSEKEERKRKSGEEGGGLERGEGKDGGGSSG